ncbi:MAG: mycothiol conjugate amidase Mca [Actinomycetota bacterium]
MAQELRLMCVHAHPDDESSKGAATMARYRAEGVEVLVVSCTSGERGDVLNPRLASAAEVTRDITHVRRREMAAAAQELDIHHVWLGFVDSGLPEGDPTPPLPPGCFALTPLPVATEALVRVVRSFQPQVIVTYDENGGYPHPDHIRCHEISVAAYHASADSAQFPQAGPVWRTDKLYYHQTFTKARVEAMHHAIEENGESSPFGEWLAHWDGEDRPTSTRVHCAEWFEVRDRALLAHATQVDPDGPWFAVPRDIERQIWPTEDYELAHSHVPVPEMEDDLFAGLRPAVEAAEAAP